MSKIENFLNKNKVILADGATGTNLFNMGLMSGDAPEIWNEIAAEKITALYQGSVDAGSDLFLTNSFGANASRLKLHDAQDRAYELSKLASELGREVADKAKREVLVAGSVGPTGEIMGEAGTLSHEVAVEIFEETAKGLLDGGADLLWLETISSIEEFEAASEAFGTLNATWVGTMSFDTAGRTMMGVTSRGLVEFIGGLENKPFAFGANCGVGASDLLRTIKGMYNTDPKNRLVAKGNAGIPKYVDGHIHYDGTPELMASYAILARSCGASIIGGCCGTTPEHLVAMRKALDENAPREVPGDTEITGALGPYSSASDGLDGNTSVRSRKRRRSA